MSCDTKVKASKVSFLEVLHRCMVNAGTLVPPLSALINVPNVVLRRNPLCQSRRREGNRRRQGTLQVRRPWKAPDPSAAGSPLAPAASALTFQPLDTSEDAGGGNRTTPTAAESSAVLSSSRARHAWQHVRVRPRRGGRESGFNSASCHPGGGRGRGRGGRGGELRASGRDGGTEREGIEEAKMF